MITALLLGLAPFTGGAVEPLDVTGVTDCRSVDGSYTVTWTITNDADPALGTFYGTLDFDGIFHDRPESIPFQGSATIGIGGNRAEGVSVVVAGLYDMNTSDPSDDQEWHGTFVITEPADGSPCLQVAPEPEPNVVVITLPVTS
jgi:hypothetical protein